MNIPISLDKFKFELKRRNYAKCTISGYSECVEPFLYFAKTIKETINQTIQKDFYIECMAKYVTKLQDEQKASKTINLHVNAIKSFLKLTTNIIVSKDEIPRLKEEHKLPDPLTEEEIQRIFNSETNLKHLLMLKVTYYGGLRLGDIQNLKVRNLNFERKLIHIELGKGNRDGFVPFPTKLHDDFKNFVSGKSGDDFIFCPVNKTTRYPTGTIQKIFENACERAKILGKWNVHRFRHTFASHLVHQNVNLRIIQAAMRHKNIQTTEMYTKVSADDISNMSNVLK